MGRQKYGRQLWKRLICWSQIVWMSTRLTSTVFAELLQMILPRFLSFDTFASFQTPGGQAVSCKNNRQSGKHQVKVFLSYLFCIFILIFLPHSQESFPPKTLLDNYIRQENVRQKSEEMIRELIVLPLSNQKGLINIPIISEIANSSTTNAI